MLGGRSRSRDYANQGDPNMESRPLVFVNYRHDDTREWTTLIADWLQRQFGRDAVFVDSDNIRAGDEWPNEIEAALKQATVFLPIIGPQWLAVHDQDWRRRIDSPDDWVRREIERALISGKPVISVLVAGAAIPRANALPPSLGELQNRQTLRVEDKNDIRSLMSLLEVQYGFKTAVPELNYPTPVDRQPELLEPEIRQAMQELPEWSVSERENARSKNGTSIELIRVFKFKTFTDAIHFMATAARYIRVTGHHPFWENQYKDVRVKITTWDVGHRITWKDIRLAQRLDRQYEDYVPYDPGGRLS